MKGLFLVLEGGDGVGKSSQLQLLADVFKKNGHKAHAIHFPRLEAKPYGEIITDFLRGDFGPLEAVHPKLVALLYALDRQQAAVPIRELIDGGAVILADRYIFSNIAYQCAKISDPEQSQHLADWIEQLEYGFNAIPRPDLTLYLDVPLEFARKNLIQDREGKDRDYLEGGKDIHENSQELQKRVREQFLALAKARTGEIGIVNCYQPSGQMADKQTVHSRIMDALKYYGLSARIGPVK